MTTTFGDAYQSVDPINRGAGSEFMESFIRAKKSFQGTERLIRKITPIKMNVSFPNAYYKDDLSVRLTPYVEPPAISHSAALGLTIGRDIMKSFFDPVISHIISLIGRQIKAANSHMAHIDVRTLKSLHHYSHDG
jgi:hypothetical protein